VIVIEQLQGDAHSGHFDACLLLALHMPLPNQWPCAGRFSQAY
jgi:hypothetical protein